MTTFWNLTLTLMREEFAICRLPPDAPEPIWAAAGPFTSVTRTSEELSVTCVASAVPEGVVAQCGWRGLKVEGPFELATTVGVLAALAGPLASAGISVSVISTYDTDYLFIHAERLAQARLVLTEAGHRIREADPHAL